MNEMIFELLRKNNIKDIAEELFGNTSCESYEADIDCPVCGSNSHSYLSIFTNTNRWVCNDCGVGGNVIHFVEHSLHGVVSKPTLGGIADTHLSAINWLANRCGMHRFCLNNPDEKDVLEEYVKMEISSRILFDYIKECNQDLITDKEVIELFLEGDESNIPISNIGVSHGLKRFDSLRCNHSIEDILSTGLFFKHHNSERIFSYFPCHIVIPYIVHGSILLISGINYNLSFNNLKCPLRAPIHSDKTLLLQSNWPYLDVNL